MKLNLTMPNNTRVAAVMQPWEADVGAAGIRRVAQTAEALGFGRITVGEHVAIPAEHRARSGTHYMHATTALGFLAGATSTLRIGSNVALLPLQHPIVQAKAWAVLDWLSDGRADLLVGVGWLAHEFELLGVDFHRRGAICDEYIAAMIEIWTSDRPEFHGEFVDFGPDDVGSDPKPIQQPHLPVGFAGDAPGTLRRVARWGTTWAPFQTPLDRIPESLDRIRQDPAFHGRPLEVFYSLSNLKLGEGHAEKTTSFDFHTDDPERYAGQLAELAGFGITEVAILMPRVDSLQAYLDRLHWLAEEVVPRLR